MKIQHEEQMSDPSEAQLALIGAIWRLLDENNGDFDSTRDQFENALAAWTPSEESK